MEWRGQFYISRTTGSGATHTIDLSPSGPIDASSMSVNKVQVLITAQGADGRGTGTFCDKFWRGRTLGTANCARYEVVIKRLG